MHIRFVFHKKNYLYASIVVMLIITSFVINFFNINISNKRYYYFFGRLIIDLNIKLDFIFNYS